CAQGASSALMYWNLPDRFPVKMAFGQESQESLLSRSLAEYPAASFLNRKIEPGQQVLAVGGDTIRIYLSAPMATSLDRNVEDIVAHSTPTTLASHLIENRFAYLYVNRTSWQYTVQPPYLDKQFLSKYGVVEYTNNNVDIYRLREVAVEQHGTSNLLANPGF